MRTLPLLSALVLASFAVSSGSAQESALRNPTKRDLKDERVRLKTPAPAGPFTVRADGMEVPAQTELIGDTKWIWVLADFAPGAVRKFQVTPGKPKEAKPRVTVKRDGENYLLDNGIVRVRVPAVASGGAVPGPVAAYQIGNDWVGGSRWQTALPLKSFSATVIGDGTVFGKVRLRYDFDGKAGLRGDVPAFSEVDVSLAPGWSHVEIAERHEMNAGDYWEFEASKGWSPREGFSRTFSSGGFGDMGAEVKPDRPLLPGARPYQQPDLFINLLPRWSQSYKDGWFFAASDGSRSLGAVVVRASQWVWPHENSLRVLVKETGSFVAFRAPTRRGQRLWWMFGPDRSAAEIEYIARHAWEHPDKLNHDYILDWPGNENGTLGGINFYDNGQMNPTGGLRGKGRGLMSQAGKKGSYSDLLEMQHRLHPDAYGSYWNFWSPQNANFFTDFNKVPILQATMLKDHPQFAKLRQMAEDKMREDVFHAVTLPGGAGQECPGYQHYAVEEYEKLAEVTRQHLKFDPTTWERFKAAKAFYERISQPDGDKRRALPMGDTHPDRKGGGGPHPVDTPPVDVAKYATQELPGFGVIFNNKPGTAQETYVAFKSGPNRGHYHGDQLALHYAANGKALAVDHHASYNPRPGQEHMHNRLSFANEKFAYANMDGYERIIAFKTSPVADVAVGQVESDRLRAVKDLPPETWDQRYPRHDFSGPLTYRRTVVLMKAEPEDYLVVRDQFWAPEPLTATFNLHVRSDKIEQKGQTVSFGNLALFCASPAKFDFKSLPWSHENGGLESTQGARLSVTGDKGEFITVIHPGASVPAASSIPGGVKVGSDEITFAGDQRTAGEAAVLVTVKRVGREVLTLPGSEINLDRPQGEIGLFVTDAGYPFGDPPDWLVKQRTPGPSAAAKMK